MILINGKEWKFGTTLRFIEGDGMDYQTMWDIMMCLIDEGFAPYGFGLFGMGGDQRNNLKRDIVGVFFSWVVWFN